MFFLVIGGTKTIKHPGISAAGASHELLPYTAALDAEYICLGKTLTLPSVPVSPAGIVSPALITRRCLDLLKMPLQVINAGAPVTPQLSEEWMTDLGALQAESVETGMAIEFSEVLRLYEAGRNVIARSAATLQSIIIAECVVGGTTTAQGLLRALSYDVSGLMSSSIPNGNHSLKADLVEQGYQAALKRSDFSPELVAQNPLLAISAMGDPMQAVVAGIAVECIERGIEFTLAGGSQMIAIASLVEKMIDHDINVVTTPWVMNDKSARIQDLLSLCCKRTKLSAATSIPDELKELPLAAYDQGHVKEGVGAGALMQLVQANTSNIYR